MVSSHKWFTLIEIIITIMIFMMLFVSSFALISIITQHTERNKTIIDMNKFLFWNNGMIDISSKSIAFYSYADLVNNVLTETDFENQFRKDLKELITNVFAQNINPAFTMSKPTPCINLINDLMEHEEEKYVQDYQLNLCTDDISQEDFKKKYNLLAIVDKEKWDVTIFIVYKYRLFEIKTKLNTDLTKNDILYKDPKIHSFIRIVPFREDLIFSKFHGSSKNFCGNSECIFKNFSSKWGENWIVDIEIIKMKKGDDDRYDFNTSFKINILKNLNIDHE